jgi:hypothetical protein
LFTDLQLRASLGGILFLDLPYWGAYDSAQLGETMAGADKRFSPRLNATAKDYVVYVEGSGRIRDISLGGVFIEDRQPFPVGTVFGFTLSLGNEMVPLKGVVRQCVPEAGMGVRFHEVSLDARNRLERILNNMVRAHAGKG